MTSWFNLVRVHNSGAAFKLPGRRVGLAALVLRRPGRAGLGLHHLDAQEHPTQKLFCFAVTMIMGGAIGNVVDRLLHSYVVDFIQPHYGGWYFPAFNLATAPSRSAPPA